MKIFNTQKYHNKRLFYFFSAIITIVILVFIIAFGLFFGAEKTDFKSVLSKEGSEIEKIIVFNIRLPRLLLAALCGMLLGGAGAVFQGFFRNPLADAGLVGISSGATLGAVLSIFLPLSFLSITILSPVVFLAFVGALGAAFLVYMLSFRVSGSHGTVMMLLIGTVLSAFLSAIVSILLLLRYQELHQVYVWTLGSFNGRGWHEILVIIGPAVISIGLLFLCVRPLDVLSQGEESAQSLGVDLKKTRLLTLLAGSLACACAVSVAGTIGFIGLIAPHIARKLYGQTHKCVLVFGMLWGAILLVLSDTLARIVLSPSEVPVGVVTALLGVPFFIVIIQKKSGFTGE